MKWSEIMNLRPMGPGVGGLNYESLRKLTDPADGVDTARVRTVAADRLAWLARYVAALAQRAAARAAPFAERLCEARMAQAQRQVADLRKTLGPVEVGRPTIVRYY
jgi:hypothetical protein